MTSLDGFLESLFTELDRHEIRYCVLHSYERLPQEMTSDLDMALHPADFPRLNLIFDGLDRHGYRPLQSIRYSAGGPGSTYLVFGWFGSGGFQSAAIDFTCEHREGGVILMSGEELIHGRRKRGMFWVPQPAIEFQYLLAKKLLKGAVSPLQAERISSLAREIGRESAVTSAARLFSGAMNTYAVDACLNDTLASEVAVLRRSLVRTIRRRDPLNRARYLFTEAGRLWARTRRPTGMCVAVLGPDGVGKSSLIQLVTERIGGCFRLQERYHWRPQLLWPRGSGSTGTPHGRRRFSGARSAAHLLGHALDFVIGYWVVVHPTRIKSGLAIFDRYFDDLLVDPARYRYGGPPWLPRMLRKLIPRPELLLILDAPAEAILTRKQELGPDQLQQLRSAYRELAYEVKSAHLIDATGSSDEVADRALRSITDYLATRFNRDHGRRVREQREIRSAQLDQAIQWLENAGKSSAGETTPEDKRRAFAVVPSKREPRWIIPLHDGSLSAAAMTMFNPYTNRARFFKRLVLLSLKLQSSAVPGDIISLLANGESPLEALVAEKLGERDPVFGVSFGTSGRHRKLTVQVMRSNGDILAYIKIPMTSVGNERVRHEASVLTKLARFPVLRSHIPDLIFAGDWQDRCVLIQHALKGESGPTRLTSAHFAFLQLLWNAQPVFRSGHEVVAELSKEWNAIAGRLDLRWKQLADEALSVAYRRIGGITVPCGITHGDFAPWNTRTENGHLGVFDWECAGWQQPIWWDIFHFETQSSTLLKHAPRNGILRADPRTVQTIYMMYLISSTCQILRDEPTDMDGLQYRRERLAAELLRPARYAS